MRQKLLQKSCDVGLRYEISVCILNRAMRNACDADSHCGLACDASACHAKSLTIWIERCEPLRLLGNLWNVLSGTLPQTVAFLTAMLIWDMGTNRIAGSIPQGLMLSAPTLCHFCHCDCDCQRGPHKSHNFRDKTIQCCISMKGCDGKSPALCAFELRFLRRNPKDSPVAGLI